MDSLAIGVVEVKGSGELSLQFARAIVFETTLDRRKDQQWMERAQSLVNSPFDAQAQEAVTAAIDVVAAQMSEGESSSRTTIL